MTPSQRQYIALLRAINVGGHSVVKMADLQTVVESLNFTDVTTYIQTGNILFKAKEIDIKRLARMLEKQLESSLGYRTTVFVLSPAQLKEAAAHNPFEPERLDKKQRCHLMFLSEEPDSLHRKALMALQGDDYRFHIHGKILYWAYPKKAEGQSRRTINFEKVLGVVGRESAWSCWYVT